MFAWVFPVFNPSYEKSPPLYLHFFSQSLSDAKEINCLNIPWALKGSILPAGWWQAVADGLKLTIARAKTGAL